MFIHLPSHFDTFGEKVNQEIGKIKGEQYFNAAGITTHKGKKQPSHEINGLKWKCNSKSNILNFRLKTYAHLFYLEFYI